MSILCNWLWVQHVLFCLCMCLFDTCSICICRYHTKTHHHQRGLDFISNYNFNRSEKEKSSEWENIYFLSTEYLISSKNKQLMDKKKQWFAKESTDACSHEVVFKCANQFHPRVHLCFKAFVSDVLRGIFQMKVFLMTGNTLYLHSLSKLSPFPRPVAYKSDIELREMQLRLKK